MDISDVLTYDAMGALVELRHFIKEKTRLSPKVYCEMLNYVYMLIRIQMEADCLAKRLSKARSRLGAVLNDDIYNRHINLPPLFDMFRIGTQELRDFANYMREVIHNRLIEANQEPINGVKL